MDYDNVDAHVVEMPNNGNPNLKIAYEDAKGKKHIHTYAKKELDGKTVHVKGRFSTISSEPKDTHKLQTISRGVPTALMSQNRPNNTRPLSATASLNTRKKNAKPSRMNKVTYPSPQGGSKTQKGKKSSK